MSTSHPNEPGLQPAGLHEAEPGRSAGLPDDEPARLPPVRIIRSAKRKESVSARVSDGVLVVRVPDFLTPDQEHAMISKVLAKFEERWRCAHVPLMPRARELAARFGLPVPRSIRWSSRQRVRWGSCTSINGDIRISSRLADAPPWVLDHVIIHELAHLVVAGHGPEFHALVNQNPNAERAEGYLLALSDMGARSQSPEQALAS